MSELPKPAVVSELGFVYLHFHDGNFQSLMRKSRPYRLELGYTRTLMGFLLFRPEPEHVVLIGLGGGSMAKYGYRNLPKSRITAVEIDPQVIALRREFHIPEDDARFRVICADGADFVASHQAGFDVLTVDGFDAQGQSPQLCSETFYRNAHAALTADGVLAVNVLAADTGFADHLACLQSLFAKVVVVPSEDCENRVIFALKSFDVEIGREAWLARAAQLEVRFGLKFRRIVERMCAAQAGEA